MSHYDDQREAELTMQQERDISKEINHRDSLFCQIFKKLNKLESRVERLEKKDANPKNDTE